jgi:hypothetical protein
MRLLEKISGRSRDKGQRLLFLRVMPHTLPESDRSFWALKKPTFIAQYASATQNTTKLNHAGKR